MTGNITSIEPATGEFLWMGEAGDADREVALARAAFPEWAAKSLAYRSEALRRYANAVRSHKDKFADLIARETGKPLWESATEVDAVVNKVDISIAAYRERTPKRKLEGALGAKVSVRHKPHGVLAVLGPYNFPAHLPNGHIVPALLAGNAVVFKPSEKTSAVGEFLVSMFHEAGLPEGLVRLLIGGPDQGRALASHPGIDGLLFTGSVRAGMALHRQFAETPQKILALELGGNNPLVVWKAPDAYQAAVIAVQSAFLSAGQRCTAARRLIVKDGEHQELIDAIAKLADRLIVDKPHATPAPFMGPVIDNSAAEHLEERFHDLVGRGGLPIKPLERLTNDRPFLSPAVIDVTDVAERPDEELFGPVLQVIRVPDFESAIAEANATRFGLAASLVGGSPQLFDKFWAHVRAGVINWNKPTNGAPSNAPFGGVGLSGNHRPSAYYAADYCAYPVTSSEVEQVRASIGVGLADAKGRAEARPAETVARASTAKRKPAPAAAAPADPAKEANEPAAEAEEAAEKGRQTAQAEEAAAAEAAATKKAAAEQARRAAEATAAEQERRAAEAAAAEEARRAAEAAAAEEERRAAEAAAAEEARQAAEAAAAEKARLAAEKAAAEEARRAAAAEKARLAEESAAADRARRAAEKAAAEEARRAAEEAAAVQARQAAEAAAAEKARRAAEQAAAEEARRAAKAAAAEEARRVAEERRLAEAAAAEEARRKAEEAAAERAIREAEAAAAEEERRAAEAAAAEEARLAAEAVAAEEARRAAQAAEEARLAAEAAAAEEARRAAEQAAAEEAARRAAEAAAAEEARRAAEAEAAEQARKAAEAAAAEEARRAAEAAAAEQARKAAEAAAAEEARRTAEAAAAEEARRAAEATVAEQARRAAEPAPPAPPARSSVPRGPVVPMLDGRAERLADEAETKADKSRKR